MPKTKRNKTKRNKTWGKHSVDVHPYRSPVATFHYIRDIITDKTVCDLGCSKGDAMILMSHYAKDVKGIELCEKKANCAKRKGLNVIQENFLKCNFPEADVYFSSPTNSRRHIPSLIDKMYHSLSSDGVLVIGGGQSKELVRLGIVKKVFNCEYREFTYNEGDDPRQNGIFGVIIIHKNKVKNFDLSFKKLKENWW